MIKYLELLQQYFHLKKQQINIDYKNLIKLKGENMSDVNTVVKEEKRYSSARSIAEKGNHLISQNSVYLQHHSHNPIDWYPWGDEALKKAKNENKPVFLSIGYSSCHWCHVMEREVFQKLDVADYMNKHFVSIKVDREERPDIDAVYMEAVQAMTGGGGWPMTVFLTPDLVPFYGGTYFPKRNFMAVVEKIIFELEHNRELVLEQGQRFREAVEQQNLKALKNGKIDFNWIDQMVDFSQKYIDFRWGGFSARMKFPTVARWKFLFNYYRKTGDEIVKRAVKTTLNNIASGGIYDQLEGGFHRYTTENTWLIPHFEKMLYDNAQLASLYIDAYSVFRDERYREVSMQTLGFLLKRMNNEEGGFYSSMDADSGGVEGSYYVWDKQELIDIAGENDGNVLADYLGVSEAGNFDGKNVLTKRADLTELSEKYGLSEQSIELIYRSFKDRLVEYRNKRIKPHTDKKIITSWNGLVVSALSKGYQVLGDNSYKQAAEKTVEYLLDKHMDKNGRLLRASNNGVAENKGILDDYAFLSLGLLDLFTITQKFGYLKKCMDLVEYVEKNFSAEVGGYYLYEKNETLPFERKLEIYDSVRPSGYSVMLEVLLRLSYLTGESLYRKKLEESLSAFSGYAEQLSIDMAGWYNTAMLLNGSFKDVVIVDAEGSEEASNELIESYFRMNPPNSVLLVLSEEDAMGEMLDLVPNAQGKTALDSKPTAFVCQYGTCKKPTSDVKEFEAQILTDWKA